MAGRAVVFAVARSGLVRRLTRRARSLVVMVITVLAAVVVVAVGVGVRPAVLVTLVTVVVAAGPPVALHAVHHDPEDRDAERVQDLARPLGVRPAVLGDPEVQEDAV